MTTNQINVATGPGLALDSGEFIPADEMRAPAANTASGAADLSLQKRVIFDAIRSAYDLGYSDARSARSTPGDSAPGYKGRQVEADHGGALSARIAALASAPAQSVAEPGTAYAARPDAPLPVFSKGHWTFKETGQSFSGAELDEAAFVAYRDRASHGQAPADAAPSAGAVAGPDDIDAIALTRYKVVHSHDSMFHRFAVVAGDGKQQLYLGRETECQNMARKFAGAFLDGAFYQSQIAAAPTPAAQAADSVQEDAARYRWLCCKFGETRFPCALENWLEHGYIADGKPSIDAAIDAAIKQGKKQ